MTPSDSQPGLAPEVRPGLAPEVGPGLAPEVGHRLAPEVRPDHVRAHDRAGDHAEGTWRRPDAGEGRLGGSQRALWSGVDQSSVMLLELLAGILVWGGIGMLADRWLGTRPWLFAIGVFLGFGAGLYLIWVKSRAEQERYERERAQRQRGQTTEGSPLARQ